ncbi:MAG: PIN domain-containing protein [Microthrixaceae bacterium]
MPLLDGERVHRHPCPGSPSPAEGNDHLLLTDLVVAQIIYVLESVEEAPRPEVAAAVRSLLAFDRIVCVDPALLLRAVEVYEVDRLDFAEAYLVACAESTGVDRVVSFDRSVDRSVDRVSTVARIEPR